MGKIIAGTFNGTGAALYIGIGFLPDWVAIQNLEDTDCARLHWNRHMMRSLAMQEGVLFYTAAGILGDPRAVGDTGIRQFRGGNKLTAASTAYLVRDAKDYRESDTYGQINKWTLGSSSNRTGNFNVEADTTYIGLGSEIVIDAEEYTIVALSSNGEAANEVTLNVSVSTGAITKIGRMYDYVGGSEGDILPDGFAILATDLINVSGEMCAFEAGLWDR